MTKDKPKLYVDIDGTTTNSIATIVNLYNQDYQYYKNFKPIDWTEVTTYEFKELKCAKLEDINQLWNQSRFFNSLEFMPNALEILKILSNYFTIIFISMGYSPNLKGKEHFLKDRMPFDYEFIGINMKEYPDKSHIDMSGAIFIDDISNILDTSNASTKILFGDEYAWNSDWTGIRCYNWYDVLRTLLPYKTQDDNVSHWIRKFKKYNQLGVLEDTFLNGYCYWFAHMIQSVFAGEILYEPVECHFICKIKDRFYDIRGDVTEQYIDKELYDKDIYLHRKSIVDGCILKKD